MLKADGRRENVYDTLKKIDDEDLETYFQYGIRRGSSIHTTKNNPEHRQ